MPLCSNHRSISHQTRSRASKNSLLHDATPFVGATSSASFVLRNWHGVLLIRLLGSGILRSCAAADALVLFTISSTAFSLHRACTRPFRVFTHSSAGLQPQPHMDQKELQSTEGQTLFALFSLVLEAWRSSSLFNHEHCSLAGACVVSGEVGHTHGLPWKLRWF